MDRKQYEKFDEYGASAFDNHPQDSGINLVRYQNFQNFLDENPNVVPGVDSICCQKHILNRGKWKCGVPRRTCPNWGDSFYTLWDHMHAMRMKGVRKSLFVATHPYDIEEKLSDGGLTETAIAEYLLEGLTARLYPSSKSWYYPNRTSLFLIGVDELLAGLFLKCLGEPMLTIQGVYVGHNL